MSQHTPNELTAIFRRDHDLLTRLKTQDAHYARLAEDYHAVNRAVHRHESEAEVVSHDHPEALKTRRLALLDEVAVILEKARTAV